jgi:hypothetical protein
MFKAYQGANGWYVAWEDDNGFHRQPSMGPWMTESEAKRAADEKNDGEREQKEAG